MDTATTVARCSVSFETDLAFEACFEKDCYLGEVVDCNIEPSIAHKTPKEPTTKCWGTQTMFASRLWSSQKKRSSRVQQYQQSQEWYGCHSEAGLWISPGKASQTDVPWPPEPSFATVLMARGSAMAAMAAMTSWALRGHET